MQRGDVHRFRLPNGGGHEQHGERYGVIVQADELLPRSVVIVAPTSRSARPATFRPEIEVAGKTTRVLVEQLGAVDVQRLGRRVGRLATPEIWGVDEALTTVLGLS
ncbi:MAG: type II toxin-antitoxin system PemK/MazF family toxin [Acidimicrobiia bacterium]